MPNKDKLKKDAQQMGGVPTVDVKRDELKKLVNDSLTQLNTAMEQAMGNLTQQITGQLNTIIQNLSKEVEIKLNEVKSLIPIRTPQTTASDQNFLSSRHAYFQGGGGVNEPTPKKKKYKSDDIEHVVPRGDGENTPMFWKENFDYGYGPYINLDKMEGKKITDYEHTLNKDDGRYGKRKNKKN